MERMGGAMKTAVISGGAGGLGRALSAGLQQRGWRVVLLDLNVSDLTATPTQLPIGCDLTKPEQLQEAVLETITSSDGIDLVIYNAGVTQIRGFDVSDDTSHRKLFEINYFAAVAMARAFPQRPASPAPSRRAGPDANPRRKRGSLAAQARPD